MTVTTAEEAWDNADGVRLRDDMRFYEREGCRRTDGYGPSIDQPMARCFTLDLT
jgi:hypothetical protein